MGNPAPLRVLCLHGYTQTAKSFQKVLSLTFLPQTSHLASFVFVDAPHAAREARGGRTWWHPEQVQSETGSSRRWLYTGWEASVEYIRQIAARQGPFDGILGFSQGACVTAALAAEATRPESDPAVRFKFGVMVGGFSYRGQGAGALFKHRPLRMPSLHVYGARDKIVKPTSSAELARLFDAPSVHEHSGGHAFPQTRPSVEAFADFLRTQQAARCAN
jgi:predicted esterase